jgi:acyl-CoA dehydrogenase
MAIKRFPHQERNADIRDAVRSICEQFPSTYWVEHDDGEIFPEEFAQAITDAGFKGVLIPEEYGGSSGTMDHMVAVIEEIAAGGGGINASSSVHIPLLAVPSLLEFGTEEQKKELLPKIANGELFITFGVTEPDAGSDTTRIRTAAKKIDGGWRVNGGKVWNSGALQGDKVLALVRTSEPEPHERRGMGLTLMLIDLSSPNIEIRAIPKIGRNAVPSCEVTFSDVDVPDDAVVGRVGEGFYHLLHSLNGERLLLSATALGMGRWAIENATRYANERVVFGRPIGQNQSIQHPLAKDYVSLLAASEVLSRAVQTYDEHGGEAVGALANAAKYLTTEAAFSACDSAMQTFGGYSYAKEYNIGRHWIESRMQRIAPVSNQLVLNYIAERQLGLPRS